MTNTGVDLSTIFSSVTQALEQNQQALNQKDGLNQNHGDNMVTTFQTITNALEASKGKSDSAALAYAAKQLTNSAASGSGRIYADHLVEASKQFKGQQIDAQGAMQLLQTLIGGGQGAAAPSAQDSGQAGGDILSNLLGSLGSGGTDQQDSGAGVPI